MFAITCETFCAVQKDVSGTYSFRLIPASTEQFWPYHLLGVNQAL